jgi:uncharacterized membrane protein YraQ (UPF0718 family)
MEEIIQFLSKLMAGAFESVLTSIYHNWLPLTLAVLTAALMKVFVDTEKLKKTLLKRTKVSIVASVVFGAFTPLCSCGTMAVIIGLLTTSLPWGPIMAFLTSSPLMSPDGFIMLMGVIGFRFAVAMTVASIIIGLGSGFITHVIQKRTTFLDNQTRFSSAAAELLCGCGEATDALPVSCGCGEATVTSPVSCMCGETTDTVGFSGCCTVSCCQNCDGPINGRRKAATFFKKLKLQEFGDAVVQIGLKQILLLFAVFVAVGYMINSFVPTEYIVKLFSADSIFSVPLAALIGLPLYVSGEGAIPLVQALMARGAGGGAMMAFMITGSGTSAWVIAGISAFMKNRVVSLYIGLMLGGGILIGYLYYLAVLFVY